jgi:hypothetical protein
MIVVVALELAEHGCGVALIDDQDVVKQLTVDSADESARRSRSLAVPEPGS